MGGYQYKEVDFQDLHSNIFKLIYSDYNINY